MTDRDYFAAAALTSLLNTHAVYHKDPPALATMAYSMADAMLRERAKTNHDAAPAAIVPEPEPPAARRRPAGGTGDTQSFDAYAMFAGSVMNWISEATSAYAASCSSDGGRKIMADACSRCWDAFDRIAPTDHGASPEARAESDEDRADKAATSHRRDGTGDTPNPISGCVSDRPTPINGPDPDSRVWETPVHTPAPHATPSVGSVPRDGTEPVAWGVSNGRRVLATSISRMDAVDMQWDYAYRTDIVPLYRKPTLTAAEREDMECAASRLQSDPNGPRDLQVADTLRGLLARLGGGE